MAEVPPPAQARFMAGHRFGARVALILIPLSVLLLGLILVHHAFLAHPAIEIPGGPIDTEFLHYVLEYGNQRLHGTGTAGGFWNAPFFYPHRNSMAYSDVLLGLLPFYAIWRLLGIDAGHAFQLWLVTLSVLNFTVAYLFLRRVTSLRRLPCALGAYCFAFASPRVMQMVGSHTQLWAEFYVVLTVWCVIRFFQVGLDDNRWRGVAWLSLAAAGAAVQLLSGFYFGWFLCFSLALAFASSLLWKKSRVSLFARLQRFWAAPIAAGIVFFSLAGPGLSHYYDAVRELHKHSGPVTRAGLEGQVTLPTLGSWIYAGDTNLLYSWISRYPAIARVGAYGERANGLGLLTSILVWAGVFRMRRHPVFRWILVMSALLLIVSFAAPHYWTLWLVVYRYAPAAPAVRIVSRLGVFLLLPISAALAWALDSVYGRRGWIPVALLGAIIALEQVHLIPHHDFRELYAEASAITAQLSPDCDSFFFSRVASQRPQWLSQQMSAMWAGLLSGIPTANGHSGYDPSGYPFLFIPNGPDDR